MRAALYALLALLVSGCGYRAGFALREGTTIGVTLFDNRSRERDIEAELHAQLTDSVQRMVGATLATPARSDYRIEGSVIDYRRRSGIRDPDNVRLESGVRVVVQARLVRAVASSGDPSSPTNVLREVTVADERGFLFSDPLGEETARAEVLRNVCDRIVIELFADMAWHDEFPRRRS
ncbi:MAG: hypothetical protein IT454_07010 [Planctomycetes bacterium]|nr:hypothetical protein [Planctomycetota bacterium]